MQVYSAGLRVRDWKYKAALACHGQSVMRCLHYSWFLRRADLCESAYIKGMALIPRPQTLRAVVMTAVCCFGFSLFFLHYHHQYLICLHAKPTRSFMQPYACAH